ncbi:MAG: 3-deoxy-7-phosphoheptulonate synthase [Firmicutes bacterium]|jgi:3-deoxy-7-phosphoheptulonate synthase|nr:3-deoxy-7-phosphoheptulonate synthase [Bacillota bacterium]
MTKTLNGDKKIVKVRNLEFGGDRPIIIAGPCSVESKEQLYETVKGLKEIGVDCIRGGIFKPRTSPFDFQGLGIEGLKYLREVSEEFDLPIVTELMDDKYLDIFIEFVDIIQVGSRNMYNYSLLKELGKTNKPILLKRGMSATIKEWVMAAEYIASNGNDNIILCERGIRSFDNYTRNLMDISAVPIMKMETGLPVIIDPSHGTGNKELILPMTKAGLAAGADGVIIEVHYKPETALCDGEQSLDLEQYKKFYNEIRSS